MSCRNFLAGFTNVSRLHLSSSSIKQYSVSQKCFKSSQISKFCYQHKSERILSYQPILNTVQHLPGLYNTECIQLSKFDYSTTSSHNQLPHNQDLPSQEQLDKVKESFTDYVAFIFIQSKKIGLHPKIVLINNLSGQNKTYQGLLSFTIQKVFLRFWVHLSCTSLRWEIENSAADITDGSITVNWKIEYLTNSQVFQFWKLTPRQFSTSYNQLKKIQYGRCIAHVKNDGLIHRLYIERLTDKARNPAQTIPSGASV